MTREEFARRNEESWNEMEDLLRALEERRGMRPAGLLVLRSEHTDPARFDLLYRMICRHLVLARERLYGTDLVERLNALALRGHRQLYGDRRSPGWAVARFIVSGFPRAVRAHGAALAVACALLFVPLIAMAAAVTVEPSLVRSVMSAAEASTVEEMYDPASGHFAKERESDTDLGMFGYYIYNNVGIAFRTFAGGLFLGAGAIFFLVSNGLLLGTVIGHMARLGYGSTFFPFVAGHSAFELAAIAIAGAAGLTLGWAILAPGRVTRAEALKSAARGSIAMLYGALLMLLLAAFLEAFWSPRTYIAPSVKYGVAALLWAGTWAYFLFAGRDDGA